MDRKLECRLIFDKEEYVGYSVEMKEDKGWMIVEPMYNKKTKGFCINIKDWFPKNHVLIRSEDGHKVNIQNAQFIRLEYSYPSDALAFIELMEQALYTIKEEIQKQMAATAPSLAVWAQKVKQRDGNRCVKCGSDQDLEAHHLEARSFSTKLQYAVNNGVTLCKSCHDDFHREYGKGYNNPLQFDLWLEGDVLSNRYTSLIGDYWCGVWVDNKPIHPANRLERLKHENQKKDKEQSA